MRDRCVIHEGGGAHYGGDLWMCSTCGRAKYPEAFACPHGRRVPWLTLPRNPWHSPKPRRLRWLAIGAGLAGALALAMAGGWGLGGP